MSHSEPNVADHVQHPESAPDPHEAVGRIVMWIIAITLFVCSAGVIIFKGIEAMPYDWIGVIGAAIFIVAAIAMTRVPSGH
jgi:hypothetical protein